MPGTRGQNTQQEGLMRMLSDISQLKTTPDANLGFLVGLETQILQFLRAPADQMGQQQAQGMNPSPETLGMGGMGGMGGMPPMPGMPGGPPMAGQGSPPAGIMGGHGMPNPDELRRTLQGPPG